MITVVIRCNTLDDLNENVCLVKIKKLSLTESHDNTDISII